MDYSSVKWLRRMALAAVIALYMVVIAGAVVRASGSGMGCPDWPRCFGRLIPPTDVSQVPPEYMQEFLTHGRGSLVHTWTEYVNRLVGAISGIATVVMLGLAIKARRHAPGAWLVVLGGLGVFLFVVWLGKVVVDTTLAERHITIHMLGALLYALAMVWAMELAMDRTSRSLKTGCTEVPVALQWHVAGVFVMLLLQIIMGTQVREVVDQLKPGDCCGGRLEEHLGMAFSWHAAGAWVTIALLGSLVIRLYLAPARNRLPVFLPALSVCLVLEYLVGVILIRMGLPALVQPLHLLIAFIMAGMLVSLIVRMRLAPGIPGSL